jgi:RAB6A-GEF complex partner protein 2
MLETHESLPPSLASLSSSRLLRRSHAEYHCSLVSSMLRTTFSLDIPPDASPAFQIEVNGEPGYLEPRPLSCVPGGLEWKVRLCLLVAVSSESARQGPDGVRLKSFVRDGPRGEWGSSWRGTPVIAPMQYPIHSEDTTLATPTGLGLRSWATYLASPFLGASPEQDGNDSEEKYDERDIVSENDEGWTTVKVETVECEVPIKVWPGNTAFKAVDVVFEV